MKVKKSRSKRKHDYFDQIDTEYKAYILGFIYADGCLSDNKGNRQKRLRICIQEEDGYILEKLIEDVSFKKPHRKYSPSIIKAKDKSQADISISSDQICNNLIKLGCNINKSQVGMQFPKIKSKFIRHFIRGFFDGDGCVTINKRIYKGVNKTSEYQKLKISLCCTSESFLEDLIGKLPIEKVYKNSRVRKMRIYNYWIERNGDIESFKNFIYKNATYFLKRKREKFDMVIKSQVLSTLKEGLETT